MSYIKIGKILGIDPKTVKKAILSHALSLRTDTVNEATEDEMSEEVPSPPGEANLKITI